MAEIARFAPTGLDIRIHPAQQDFVTLRFARTDDHVDLVFPTQSIPTIVEHILQAARLEPLKSIDTGYTGTLLSPEGHDVRKGLDGGVILTIHLRTDDGMRTMAWQMTSEKARQVGEELTKYAS